MSRDFPRFFQGLRLLASESEPFPAPLSASAFPFLIFSREPCVFTLKNLNDGVGSEERKEEFSMALFWFPLQRAVLVLRDHPGVPDLLCRSLPELCEAITRVACSSCPCTGQIVWDEQSRGFRGRKISSLHRSNRWNPWINSESSHRLSLSDAPVSASRDVC